jgi:hypothetical protein
MNSSIPTCRCRDLCMNRNCVSCASFVGGGSGCYAIDALVATWVLQVRERARYM